MASIDPLTCYNTYATKVEEKATVRNWAIFCAASEMFRMRMGLCESMDFIELQIASQLRWLDENEMYKDHWESENHQPMVYDLVTRGLFVLLLYAGYHGKYYDRLVHCLEKTAWLNLEMQSVTGELPFGGRSNGFVHNEAWLALIFEYAAGYYKKLGQPEIASRFKTVANRSLDAVALWLKKDPIRHVKNRFPTETKFGCEEYAYFDKYMITAASFLYAANLVCDPTILPSEEEKSATVWQTSWNFHKVFAKAGGYFLEFDTDADPHYDASGLGRLHRKDAPSALCLSAPCPDHPTYTIDLDDTVQLSLCPGVKINGEWVFATHPEEHYELLCLDKTEDTARVKFTCSFSNGAQVTTAYAVDAAGVFIENEGEGELTYLLPAFAFDGETRPEIESTASALTVRYEGWECSYTTNGTICDTGKMAANRNGHYRCFYAEGKDSLWVKVELRPVKAI
jgi:hypothetical protein